LLLLQDPAQWIPGMRREARRRPELTLPVSVGQICCDVLPSFLTPLKVVFPFYPRLPQLYTGITTERRIQRFAASSTAAIAMTSPSRTRWLCGVMTRIPPAVSDVRRGIRLKRNRNCG